MIIDLKDFPFDMTKSNRIDYWNNIQFYINSDEGRCMPLTGLFLLDLKQSKIGKIKYISKYEIKSDAVLIGSNHSFYTTIDSIIHDSSNYLITTDYKNLEEKYERLKSLG